MHCSHVSKSTSTVTTTATSTSTATTVSVSGVSQPESTAGQRQQGYFMGLLTTPHTPAELTEISSIYYQQDELRLLSDASAFDISASQTDSFDALTTYITATFDDDHQGQSTSYLSLSNEPSRSQKSSQPVEDVAPIVREEPSPDSIDKWIMMSGDDNRPFRCGFKGCGRKYSKKESLRIHFVTHTGDSKLRCYAGDCAGTVVYRDVRELSRHIHVAHTFERPFECELCDQRFRRMDHLEYHREHGHFIKRKKNSPKPQSVSKSSFAATATITANTSTMTSRFSQPELVAGQRQQGSFVDLSKIIHTPGSKHISTDYHQQAGLRLLAEVSAGASQIAVDPFEALAKYQTIIFDNKHQGRSASSLSLSNEPSRSHKSSQLVDDTASIVREEQSSDPTDTNKWIIVDRSQEKPFQCGYPGGCDKSYKKRSYLICHFMVHTGKSKFKCSHPGCVGNEYFLNKTLLKRHIITQHTRNKPFQCDRCSRRFGRKDHLQSHIKHVHGIKEEKKLRKRKIK